MSEENTENAPTEESTVVARAKRMGWIDKDKFNGPDEMFVSAEEFIEKGENELPILRDRLRKQDSTIVEMGRSQETMKQDMAYLKGATARAEQRGYEDGLAAAKAKQREAVEEGDTYKFDAAQAEIDALPPPPPVLEPAAQQPPLTAPEIDAFTQRNQMWYGSDLLMTDAYNKEFDRLAQNYPDFSLQQKLEAAETRIKRDYPEKFGNPRRAAAGEVEGGNGALQKKQSGKKFSDLPAEAQEMCDRFVAQNIMTRDAYVADYFEED
jgi:hypothetical protein|tara:strand:- start:6664 stop:7461 length:798 start_codon:yes stop_codon:yes gene_type:complete